MPHALAAIFTVVTITSTTSKIGDDINDKLVLIIPLFIEAFQRICLVDHCTVQRNWRFILFAIHSRRRKV